MALIKKMIDVNIPAQELHAFLSEVRTYFRDQIRHDYLENLRKRFTKEDYGFHDLKCEPLKIDKKSIKSDLRKYFDKQTENFTEVVNQMASVEGMIHALSLWSDHTVTRAHATHTSHKKGHDHDLVLVDSKGHVKYIEISSVVGKGDSNGKLIKDLGSLYRTYKATGSSGCSFYIVTTATLWDYHQNRAKSDKFYVEKSLTKTGKESLKFSPNNLSSEMFVSFKESEHTRKKKVVVLEVSFHAEGQEMAA